MYALDGLYTAIYNHSQLRSKVQLVLNAPPKQYDAVIIGSSRAENHVVSKLFEAQGLTAYNLGMSGSNLCENSLLLKLFFENGNTAKIVLLQLDLNFITEEPAVGVQALFIPYIATNNTIYEHYAANTPNSFAMKYVPFYRYCANDAKIGLREVIMTLVKKKSKTIVTDGYVPLSGEIKEKQQLHLPKENRKSNRYYDEIKVICLSHGTRLIPFMAPICSEAASDDYFKKLKQRLPELYDYTAAIKEDSLFSSCGHLNNTGAEAFTKLLLKAHFTADNSNKIHQ
jgi:hypothetical protein